MRPLFVTFEGLDGSGKSTHLRRSGEWLVRRGLPCHVTKEPGGTPLGEAIRGLFLDPAQGHVDGRVEALLVFASRRHHLLEVIEPQLAAGSHVLCDRFTDSTLAYQGAGRDLPAAWIDALDELATGRRRPDATLLFDLPAEAAQRRGQSQKRLARPLGVDRIDREDLAFYERVRKAYLDLVQQAPRRFRRIDSSGHVEATWAQVEPILEELFGGAR